MKRYLISTLLVLLVSPLSLQGPGYKNPNLTSAWTTIPSRSLAGLHYIFKGFTLDQERGVAEVTGPVVVITNGERLGAKVYRQGFTAELDEEDFEQEQELGRSIFEVTTRLGTNVGTAFLVGPNLVLTNRHVMDYTSSTTKNWECGKFGIKLNHREERIGCAKVRFCSSKHDYCVVEMKNMMSGDPLGSELKPLRLTDKVRANPESSLLHIGNAGGFGLQASRGRGIKIKDGEFHHFIPTLGGSSGAPIFNDKHEVIGINWGYSGGHVIDDAAYNHGVLSKTIYQELKRTHQYTLNDIKSFKSWYHRERNHRRVNVREPASD